MHKTAIPLYPDEIKFLKENYFDLTHDEIFHKINSNRSVNNKIGRTCLRSKIYKMGLRKGIQIRWSKKDTLRLKKWYHFMGDTQIAEHLNKVGTTYRKENGKKIYRKFTKKHVEKKRELLGLIRSPENVNRIVQDNKLVGDQFCFTHTDNAWTRGTRIKADTEEIRIWNCNGSLKRFIKVNGMFTPYTRWYYHNFINTLLPHQLVFHIDLDKLNDDPDNFEIRTRTTQRVTKNDYSRAKILIEKRIQKQIKLNEKKYDSVFAQEKREMMTELMRLKNHLKYINDHLKIKS